MATQFAFGKIVTDGLVLALDAADKNSYPGSGTTWRDMSGNGNNGTLTNGPTFSSANGGSIVFDGVDDRVIFSNNATTMGLISQSPMTAEAWVKFNNLSNYTHIIDGSSNSFHLAVESLADGGSMYFFNGNSYQLNSSPAATTGQWYHIVGIQDISEIRIYANGALLTNGTIASGQSALNLSSKTIALGYWENNNTRHLNGNIAVAKLYKRALSATEVLQNYNAQKSRFNL
jgi:hypothetical protein